MAIGCDPVTSPCYDDSGNLIRTYDGSTAWTYDYDAENRLTNVDGTGAVYTYDGSVLRIKKVTGGITTTYIYSGTSVIAEYVGGTLKTEYIYLGSQLLATIEIKVSPTPDVVTYHHQDHLSVRVSTDSTGAMLSGGEQGHYPFGEEWYKGAGGTKTQFTSYERDSESGMDYAMFRYDSSRLGRFMTPDPVTGDISNPQRLNRYTYTLNDPINLIDPLGLDHCTPSGSRDDDCKHEPRCTNGNSPGRGDCEEIPSGLTPTPPPGTCIVETVNGFATNNCDPPITVEIERPTIDCDPKVEGVEACKKKEEEAAQKACAEAVANQVIERDLFSDPSTLSSNDMKPSGIIFGLGSHRSFFGISHAKILFSIRFTRRISDRLPSTIDDKGNNTYRSISGSSPALEFHLSPGGRTLKGDVDNGTGFSHIRDVTIGTPAPCKLADKL